MATLVLVAKFVVDVFIVAEDMTGGFPVAVDPPEVVSGGGREADEVLTLVELELDVLVLVTVGTSLVPFEFWPDTPVD